MGRSYYYFAASLPMLSWDGKLPMTGEEFLEAAQRLLEPGDSDLIKRLFQEQDAGVETDNPVARAWVQFNRNLRNEIAWLRAHRIHKDPSKSVRGTKENDPFLREVVQEASKMPDLLEGEKLLDRTRWQFLDDLVNGHYYDLEFLICYGLKLKILERHDAYKSSKGREVFADMRGMELPITWTAQGI